MICNKLFGKIGRLSIFLCYCTFLLCTIPLNAQSQQEIKGIVRDDQGGGIPGANIRETGTGNGTTTDLDGNYSITLLGDHASLEFSFVGFSSESITVGTRTIIDVELKPEATSLDQVIVIGFGKSRKQDLSTAISTVENMEKLKERPLTSATEMLQGQVAGVTVVNNGGDPSGSPSINIRGKGSTGIEEPLWVVDGVPGAPVNVNDIESITILKDAASAAIYGAYSGSAGVIIVTTKQAKAGPPTITYDGVFGVSQATNLTQSLTIEDQLRVRKTAYDGAGKALPNGWDPVKNPYISQTRTDWMDEIFRVAAFQRHSIGISGGTENFANRLSVDYSDKQGTLISTHSKEISTRYNASFKLSKHIRIREDMYWGNADKQGTNTTSDGQGSIVSAMMMPRNAEAYYSDGTYGGTAPKDAEYIAKYGSNFADIHGDVINPIRLLKADNEFRRTSNISSSTFLDIVEPIKGLNFTSRFTYRLENVFNRWYSPKRLEPGKPNSKNSLDYESSRRTDWDFENTLNYDRRFNKHNIGAMLSTTTSENNGRGFDLQASNFANEASYYQALAFAREHEKSSDFSWKDRNLSVVGRLSYSWGDRYFATVSMRRDYAGRLPKDKKYGDFPSITGAWKISSEPFMPKSDFLTLLKVRASWGRIGNLGSISRAYGNPTLSVMGITNVGGQVGTLAPPFPTTVYQGTAFNPNLTWETSEQLDIGLDMAFLRNRLTVTADYYQKKTFDLIKKQDAGWPSHIGISALLINEGEIRNTGFELAIGWNDRIGDDFSYFVNANMATLKNKVHDIGPADATGTKPVWRETSGDYQYRSSLYPYRTPEGEPLNSFWLIKSAGKFKTDAEAAAHVHSNGNRIQPKAIAGDLKFIDDNNDGKIDNSDRIYMGNAMPKFTYAFTAGFTWKNLSFSTMLQGVAGVKLFHGQKYTYLNEGLGNFNRWDKILEAYDVNSDIPRISLDDPNNNFSTESDWYLENGAYLRIKNITVGYSFDKLVRKSFAKLKERDFSLSMYASVDNLYTFTSYTGIDPEVGGIGFDKGRYPVPRIFTIGIKIKY